VGELTGKILQQFIALSPDKRQELEAQGVNLTSMFTQQLAHLVQQARVGSILVVMEQGIGNMVLLTPALRNLKASHPSLKVTVLCREPAAQVIRGWDCVDNVITELEGDYYDLAYFTIWSDGFKAQYGDKFTHYCKSSIQAHRRTFHESLQHNTVAEFMESFGDIPPSHCQEANPSDMAELLNLFNDVGLLVQGDEGFGTPTNATLRPYIVFADTALRFGSGDWDAKRWPHYAELAKKIQKKMPGVKVIMVGNQEDKEEAEDTEWPDNVILDFMGAINIPQLASLIKMSQFFVGNDTGPTHIAAAVGAKTYAIFGPTLTGKNYPLGKDVTILNKRLPCSPCQYTERFTNCSCLSTFTSEEVYNRIFFPENSEQKRIILVGDFGTGGSLGAFRNEHFIKKTLEKKFGYKVIAHDYRANLKKHNGDIMKTTYELVNEALFQDPELVLICGGQTIHPAVLMAIDQINPNIKKAVWYVDNRRQIEQWFAQLSSICNASFWSTGFPDMVSQVLCLNQRPCEFLPIVPDDTMFKPMPDIEKDIDVLFVGTPHSNERVFLLQMLADTLPDDVNFQIYGNGEWPETLKKYTNPGVFNKDFAKLLNRAKIVINQNIINDVPLYFSDRYFYPMASKTVGLNFAVPNLSDMFQDGKHMVFWTNPQDVADKVKELLANDKKRNYIAEQGYKLYKEKYTLQNILRQLLDSVGLTYTEKK